jgi:phosphomevalonate kinase
MTDQPASLTVSASAPGKVVLAGEYAVLDGAPAICAALDRRARVKIVPSETDHHVVTAPGFSAARGEFLAIDGELQWLAAGGDFPIVADVWHTANAAPSANLSLQLDTREFIDAEQGVKIGIGSSAALTTALAAALCEVTATDADATRIAFAAHRQFQGGLGSGVDVACSSAGGLIEYRMGEAKSAALDWPEGLAYALFWSGVVVGTGAKIERLDAQQPKPSRAALVYAARRIANAWRGGSATAILAEYRDYTKVLREFSIDHGLGIFAAGHAEMAGLADAAGLVYKPCGAGGGDVGIVLADNEDAIAAFAGQELPQQFQIMNARLDPFGVQVERNGH